MTISITVKTLQQKQFKVDAELSDTVGQLKAKIENANGAPVANQKLVYSGKILSDEKTVEECNIKEKDFLVLMVSKPKPAPAASTSASSSTAPAPASAPVPPPTDQVPPAPVPAPAEPAIQPPASTASTTTTTTPGTAAPAAEMPAFGDMSAFVTGSALQTSISNLVEMGFPQDQVLAAMRASYNNPDRAVEYLMTGIPEHLQEEARQQPPRGLPSQAPSTQAPSAPSAPTVQQQAPAQPGNLFQAAQQASQHQPGAGGGRGLAPGQGPGIDIAALQNSPALAQIRTLAQQNPALVQPLLQQLLGAHPELAQVLAQNPDLLVQLLGGGAGSGGLGEGDDDDNIPEGAQVIQVTPEEAEAIQRLEALGFSRNQAAQAYFACGKNEELAANFLFEGGFDD
ncbi:hypothetical protein FRB90_009573 [Tulasnella sp. 427]|nr:hypothetical protein FRB90_009573 [Tulasnella sp. 427]